MKNIKKVNIAIIGIAIIFVMLFFTINKFHYKFSDEESDFFVWSTGGCNGIYTILGMRTDNVTGVYRGYQVYPIDSLDNKEFVGLTYPFQINDTIYYTTTDTETSEKCIISKK